MDSKPKYCKDCKSRKACFCNVQEKYVPRKASCEKFDARKK